LKYSLLSFWNDVRGQLWWVLRLFVVGVSLEKPAIESRALMNAYTVQIRALHVFLHLINYLRIHRSILNLPDGVSK
jgi:hypothetical protein